MNLSKPELVTISMPLAVRGVVDDYAKRLGLKRSDVFRLALYQFLDIPAKLAQDNHMYTERLQAGACVERVTAVAGNCTGQ